jgi:LPS-assembly lipoprotein
MKKIMTRIKNTFLLLTLLFISACGYHLRGGLDLPEGLKSIYLQDASGQLRNAFNKALRSADVKLAARPEDAGIVVKVSREKMRRRVISVSNTGRANEYELYYKFNFILLDAEGEKLSETQPVEITRTYFIDQETQDILAKNIEEQTIRDEMYRQAIQTIINRSRVALEKNVIK